MKIAVATDPDTRQACFDIRRAVFIEEQGVTEEEEWDGLEDQCIHFIALDGETPAATIRVFLEDSTAKVQRVAVMESHRGTGLGQLIMTTVLDTLTLRGAKFAKLEAQVYAIPFYERLGFAAEGPEFDDAGIPHRLMTRKLED